jgi:hypothetical protein
MHQTHQRYKQIWAHLLPSAHPLWQPKEGQPHVKQKIKPSVKINILNKGYALHDKGIA